MTRINLLSGRLCVNGRGHIMQATTFPSVYGIDLMAFTERLAQFRKDRGLTQKDLAAIASAIAASAAKRARFARVLKDACYRPSGQIAKGFGRERPSGVTVP